MFKMPMIFVFFQNMTRWYNVSSTENVQVVRDELWSEATVRLKNVVCSDKERQRKKNRIPLYTSACKKQKIKLLLLQFFYERRDDNCELYIAPFCLKEANRTLFKFASYLFYSRMPYYFVLILAPMHLQRFIEPTSLSKLSSLESLYSQPRFIARNKNLCQKCRQSFHFFIHGTHVRNSRNSSQIFINACVSSNRAK